MTKTFFITGVSKGLGLAFAKAALDAGHNVVGTLRDPGQIDAFEALAPGRATARLLDVTNYTDATELVGSVEANIGPIDVVICNAGYGAEGTVEETSMDELRHQFDVNVFGTVAVIKAVLPYLRRRRHGHIVTVSSMAGLTGLPGVAFYAGSKFAIEGITDSLAQEIAGFGISVTALALGAFRTDWAGRSMVRVERTIADYDSVFDPIRDARQAKHGNQAGDPAAAAHALLSIVDSPEPPVHLVLGGDALAVLEQGRRRFQADLDAWAHLSTSTGFPAPSDDLSGAPE
jgi:NAD(P)-dependent dehydrogenase (short-subunit alcohol dehydrogenase family)